MKKKILRVCSLLATLALAICLPTGVVESVSAEERSEVYTESGQINLNNLRLSLKNETVAIQAVDMSPQTANNMYALRDAVDHNPNLKTGLMESIQNDNQPMAIGYTTVYLKEVDNGNNESHFVPMTEDEYVLAKRQSMLRANISGPETKYKQLTSWTSAGYNTRGGTRTLNVYGYADWAWAWLQGDTANANPNGYDFISIALSTSDYVCSSYSLITGTSKDTGNIVDVDCYKAKDLEKAVAWGLMAWNKTHYQLYAPATVSSSTPKRTIKATTQYLHTWKSFNPSISYNSGGSVTFGGAASNYSWEIASSVTLQA